jgi:uncharacterized protein
MASYTPPEQGVPHAWIDLEALARAARPLSGSYALTSLARVHGPGAAPPGAQQAQVHWRAQAEWRDPPPAVAAAWRALSGSARAVPRQLWLHLWVQGEVPLVCQRCLEPYLQPVLVDRWFRFVADEATAEAEDEACEEDLLVLPGARFHLLSLVEDELLLGAPLVPMHEVCPRPLPLAAGDHLRPAIGAEAPADAEPATATPTRRPFEVLASLALKPGRKPEAS